MADRKVLINRHSTKNQAPAASEMFLGEIAVSHPSDLSATTIWTLNNDVMVPFASCAMTMQMIDNAITAANVTYDVKEGQSEPHIEVATAGTGTKEVTFTLTSNDIQSEEEFKAYSARTNNALTALTKSFADLLDVTLTAGTGDDIITVTSASTDVSANTFSVTHKTATAVTGFNKLDTDAYGHVTAATPVATADIEALGFKTSAVTDADLKVVSGIVDTFSAATVAEFNSAFTAINTLSSNTEAAIEKAINDLDSTISASTTGNYITAIEIKDGKLQKVEEAAIPVLEVESAGTGNVVSSIAVDDHKITYQTVSVATSEQINALSASVINLSAVTGEFSGATDAKFTELSGATEAISDYAHDEIAALSAGTIQLSADTKATIGQLSAGTIQLSADTYAAINQLSGYAHGEIVELSGAVQANETDIDNLSAATLDLSAVTITGVSLNNTPLTVTDHVVSVPVADDKDDIAGATATGNVADAKAVKDYVADILSSSVDYKGATASAPTGTPSKGDLYIASGDFTIDGKNVETGDFIIYNGTGWDVIEKNLDGAITGNLTVDTVTLGDSTNSVKSLANGTAGQVLTIGTAGTPVWADDPVLSTATTGNGNVVSEITVNDHEITYVKNFTAATNADLEIVSGIVDTFSAATESKINALSAGTISLVAASAASVFSSAKTYTDKQIDEVYASGVSYTNSAITVAIEALDSETAVTEGNYITGIAIKDGKISGITQTALPANVAITATTGAAVDTPSAVLTGVTTDGTDNHNLTFGMSNKVFSASTADIAQSLSGSAQITSAQVSDIVVGIENTKVNSAFTAESAVTSVSATVAADAVHASAATKVDSALTMTDGTNTQTYDGSAAKTLTFGTTTSISGQKSMSMDTNGVVDVDVIDCGEY